MDETHKIGLLMYLISSSDLDQTIKDILVRDLQDQGLTDYMREQIKAYCLEGLRKMDVQTEEAKKILEENPLPVTHPAE
jgi:hypothetical protein